MPDKPHKPHHCEGDVVGYGKYYSEHAEFEIRECVIYNFPTTTTPLLEIHVWLCAGCRKGIIDEGHYDHVKVM